MLISVIVPVYNVEKYLEDCINSIISQKYGNIEILLINDGSTDVSGKICDKYSIKDSRVRVFHQENKGVSSARNLGIYNAKGDYLYFLDSDDYITADFFKYAVNIIKNNDSDILFFSLKNNNEKEIIHNYSQKQSLYMLMNFKLPSSLWLGFYRKKLFINNFLNTEIHFYEDLEYQYRLIYRAGKITTSNLNFHNYNQRDGSANNQLSVNEKVLTCLKIKDSLLKTNVIPNSDAFDLHCMFVFQCVFYALKSDQLENNIACVIQKETRENLKRILILKRICLSYKLLAILFAISTKFSFFIFNSWYKRFLNKRLK